MNKETCCERCPSGVGAIEKIAEIEGHEFVLPLIQQTMYLHSLKDAGATFLLNDLSQDEWLGLMSLNRVRAKLEKEFYDKEKEKMKAKEATRKASSRK